VPALADAMVLALGADRDRIGAAGRRTAEVSFSAERFAREIAAVLAGSRGGSAVGAATVAAP
jgi:glycosyltransferase involved in cell wall biosynthesis